MKKILLLCVAFLTTLLRADNQIKSEQAPLMPVGAYYYPEHWPREQWSRDLQHMASLGFQFTHFAEFAWARMEPREGVFDFEWLDTCIEEAGRRGMKVILCTPSACPPAWLTHRYPEMLNVNADGIQSMHGGNRLHANPAHPVYRHYVGRIVSEMAKRYGNNPHVWGWQIDNEPHLATIYDYSPFARKDFHQWLRRKYGGDLNALNQAWGNAFWSSTATSWDEIEIPNEKRGGTNPHALLDFKRYTADVVAEGIRFQAQLLRKHVSPTQWVTTNYAYYKFLPPVDLFRNRGDLDFASHTMYLLSTFLDAPEGALGFRLGSGMELAFSAEMAKSIEGKTAIMELQPGQINWGRFNAQPLPGAVRMWVWHAFGLGDRFVCTYRFRQPIYGSEHTHKGIIETDGVTVSRGGAEFVQALQELKKLGAQKVPNATMPTELAGRRVALQWKQDNLWELQNSPHTQSWDTWRHVYGYYSALKSAGSPVTFVSETDRVDPKEHPFLVVPAYSMADASLVNRWKEYAAAGGHLILSCRTGQKDDHGRFPETRLQAVLQPLIGASIEDNDQLPPDRTGSVKYQDQVHSWSVIAELLKPAPGTEVIATYGDHYYQGTPAVTRRTVGKGSVTYIGVETKGGTLERQIVRDTMRSAGATLLDLPPYAYVEWRDGFWIGVNYTSETVDLQAPANATFIYGTGRIAPGEVAVWTLP